MSLNSFFAIAIFLFASTCQAEILYAGPDNYLVLLKRLFPGDTLELAPGKYRDGLPIHRMNGRQGRAITIMGSGSGVRSVFLARGGSNTVSLVDSSYITLQNLELDGLNMPGIDAVKAEGHAHWTHHITVENLIIRNHGGDQLTVGISTKCPSWNWVIRNNVIAGAGTGLYLGNSDGTAPFIDGLIENNLVTDSLGYNLQVKHQKVRMVVQDMPKASYGTIIRHNVFSKMKNASERQLARPNVLVGHFPLGGQGADDRYFIYGNFFYDNPTEALFQGEGNIALYNNLFVNPHGDAVHIQPHNDVPRDIAIFFNTVVATGDGISVRGVHPGSAQKVSANAVFAKRDTTGWMKGDPFIDSFQNAAKYLMSPFAELGKLDLYPLPGRLSGNMDVGGYFVFPDWDRDFNGTLRTGKFRGAYEGEGHNPGWLPSIEMNPRSSKAMPWLVQGQ